MLTTYQLKFVSAIAALPTLFVAPSTPPEALVLVKEILEEFYTDGITDVVSATLDKNENIVGQFTDQVGLRQIKAFNYRIQENQVSYSPSAEVGKFSIEQFATGKRNCNPAKSFPCGGSCQPLKNKDGSARECLKAPSEQSKDKIAKAKATLGKKDAPKSKDVPVNPVPTKTLTSSVKHKPFMSKEDAIAYTKDSVYSGKVFYHATSGVSADSITTDGVSIERNKTGLYGKGFYVGGGKNGRDVAKFYGSLFGTKGEKEGAILEIRLNVKNPRKFEDMASYMSEVKSNKAEIRKTKVPGVRKPTEEERISQYFKNKGFDAVEITKAGEFVLFDPKQVAIYKRGKF